MTYNRVTKLFFSSKSKQHIGLYLNGKQERPHEKCIYN